MEEKRMVMNDEQQKPVTLKSYLPLVLVFIGIGIATGMKQAVFGASLMGGMADFMGFFFVTFGALKVFDLHGFVESYRSYDILARKSMAYAYTYPFIELVLGVAFLMRWAPISVTIFAIVLMAVNSIGVVRALREKRHIACACLGTFLKVPLTHVSLFEDLLMLVMGLIMLIIHLK